MNRVEEVRARWESGSLSDDAALLELCYELDAVEQALAPIEEARQQTRALTSEVVEKIGGRAQVRGFGQLIITAPGSVVNYDRETLDALLVQLERERNPLATAIRAARKVTARAGHLQIKREQP
jgi:hypothetical protein